MFATAFHVKMPALKTSPFYIGVGVKPIANCLKRLQSKECALHSISRCMHTACQKYCTFGSNVPTVNIYIRAVCCLPLCLLLFLLSLIFLLFLQVFLFFVCNLEKDDLASSKTFGS